MAQVIKFLDYEIVNSGNSDGWVITKPTGKLWECNLGNYDDLVSAKKDAFIHFMEARPEEFHSCIVHRLHGTKTCHEWYKLVKVLKKEKIAMPLELKCSKDPFSSTIEFKER